MNSFERCNETVTLFRLESQRSDRPTVSMESPHVDLVRDQWDSCSSPS
jgi:hypothetical protein